jgi:hypothetical protein
MINVEIDRPSARHVDADPAQRADAVGYRAPAIGGRELREVERFDAFDCQFDGLRERIGRLVGWSVGRLENRVGRELHAVELLDLFRDERVAARADAGDLFVGDAQGVRGCFAAARFELAEDAGGFRRRCFHE